MRRTTKSFSPVLLHGKFKQTKVKTEIINGSPAPVYKGLEAIECLRIDTMAKKLKYAVAKSHRWWRNRWKYRLVYNESLVESFVWLAKNRMK